MYKAVPHFNFDGCLTCSHPRTQGAKGKLSLTHLLQTSGCHAAVRRSHCWPAVPGEGLTAHLCPCPACATGPGCHLSATTRPSNLQPPELCFPHQATGTHPSIGAAVPQKTLGTPNLDPLSFYVSLQCSLSFSYLQEATPGLSPSLCGKVSLSSFSILLGWDPVKSH